MRIYLLNILVSATSSFLDTLLFDVNKSRQIWQINKNLTLIVLKQENSTPFSEDDKAPIKKFTLVQNLWFTKVISRISNEKQDKSRLHTLLKKVKETGSSDRT